MEKSRSPSDGKTFIFFSSLRALDPFLPLEDPGPLAPLSAHACPSALQACLAVQGSLGMLAHSWPMSIRWLTLWAPSPPALSSQLPSLLPKCPFKQSLIFSSPPPPPATPSSTLPAQGRRMTLHEHFIPSWLRCDSGSCCLVSYMTERLPVASRRLPVLISWLCLKIEVL